MVELKNINMTFKKNKKEIEVLKNINYKFESGKTYVIIGPSGSGKSTLTKIIGLLLKPTSGNVLIDNEYVNYAKKNSDERSLIRNKKIGFIFQSFYLNPYMKANENVLLPCYLSSEKEKEKRAYELLKKMNLEGREEHFPKELSGGESQRVAVARALINNPNIILADEPTGSLDSENEINILNILKDLSKEGKCVIIVTHSKVVEKYADVILKIENHTLKEIKHEIRKNNK